MTLHPPGFLPPFSRLSAKLLLCQVLQAKDKPLAVASESLHTLSELISQPPPFSHSIVLVSYLLLTLADRASTCGRAVPSAGDTVPRTTPLTPPLLQVFAPVLPLGDAP